MEMGSQGGGILNCHCKPRPSVSSHPWGHGADSVPDFLLYQSFVDLFDLAWTDECMIGMQVHLYSLASTWPPLCRTRGLEWDSNIYWPQGK